MNGTAKVAEMRQAQWMTQAQLAQASGVHRVTIARIEGGKVRPTIDTLMRLAAALGVEVKDLIERAG